MALIRFAETEEGRERRITSGPIGLVNPVYPISDAADDEVVGISYEVTSSGDS